MQVWTRPLDHPIRNLIALVLVWKGLLLVVAICSPGAGYDTSTTLRESSHSFRLPFTLQRIADKLTRWDAIYFVTTSSRGYLFEQEWAFGWGFTKLIALCTAALKSSGLSYHEGLEELVAISIAHVSHVLAVLVLFQLTRTVFPAKPTAFAFTTALLHILSPAGLFLSAAYAESSCALLSFGGYLLFTKSLARKGQATAAHDLLVLLSGILFGIATTFRSNGILNGMLLLEEALRCLYGLKRDMLDVATLRRLIATGIGGLCVASGFLLPQYIAYSEYCRDSGVVARPWCNRVVPSIYTFVQDHYWNNGLFRYWTISNLPLFLLAIPMFTILILSGLWAFTRSEPTCDERERPKITKHIENISEDRTGQVLHNLALSQLLLASLTLIRAHVQIITRISSSCPVWLWYIAESAREGKENGVLLARNFVMFMIVYAIVQGGLFASFLPPA